MKSLTALSLSIGILGAVATYLALGPLSGVFLIWTAFIAWGAFFAFGGTVDALKNLIVCGVLGVILATIAAIIIVTVPGADKLGLPLWAAIVVGATVFVACIAANVPAFATIPGTVFGYASTFAYLLQTPDKLNTETLLTVTLANPLILISISIAVGGLFGLASGKLSAAITTGE